MAIINDVGGTSQKSFSINGKVSFFQGEEEPSNKLGVNGNYYFQTSESGGSLYVKINGVWMNLTSSSLPDPRFYENKLIYSNGENYDVTQKIEYNNDTGSTTFSGDIINSKTPSATNSTSSTIVPNIGWINDPTKSTNVVHKTGDETINGSKKFLKPIQINSNNIYSTILALENSTITKGEIPTAIPDRTSKVRYWTVCAVDKTGFNYNNPFTNNVGDEINHNKIGQFEVCYDTNKNVYTSIQAFNPNFDDQRARIDVGFDSNGKKFSSCDVVPDEDSNDQTIATTAWVKTKTDSAVHKTGEETITGAKTFTSNIVKANTNITKGTNPSNQQYCTVEFTDKNGEGTKNRVGCLESAIKTNGDIETLIGAYKYENNSTTVEKISVTYPKTGNPYTYAPKPTDTTSPNGTQIATTGWVNGSSNNLVHKSNNETIGGTKTFSAVAYGKSSDATNSFVTTVDKLKAQNGYFKLGNGLIVQWGRVSNTNNNNITLTFPTPFTSTNYSINAMRSGQNGGYSYDGITGVSSRTKTSCVLYSWYGNSNYDWIAVGY